MKKRSVLFSIFFFCSVSQGASIKTGDYAKMSITYESWPGGNSFKQYEVTLVDSTRNKVDYTESMHIGSTRVYQYSKSGFLSEFDRTVTDFHRCESAKLGKFETVSVPAGNFLTCHVSIENPFGKEDMYFGLVPFGLVKHRSEVSKSIGYVVEELYAVKY